MKRHEAFIPLSRDHHEILVLAQLLKADAPAYPKLPTDIAGKLSYAMEVFDNRLMNHIQIEEELLFPKVVGHNAQIDQLIYMLKDDHTEILVRFENLTSDLNILMAMDELGKLLEEHVRREERELFELLQKDLLEEALSALKTHLYKH
ncbi:MAG: hemerythrin domain-containing protein [Salibacteraceae bacterium]